MAVGLSLESKNILLFRKRINQFANSFSNMPFDKLNIECKLNPAFLSVDLVQSLSCLQPFGAGNPTPIFGLYQMTIDNIIPLSNNKHLKLVLSKKGTTINALYFFTSTDEFPYRKGDLIDLAVTLDTNEYNGNVSVSVIIKAVKADSDDALGILQSERIFEDFCLENPLSKQQLLSILPTRNDFALLYRFLQRNGGYGFSFDTLVHKLDNKLSFGKIKVIIKAMSELNLIDVNESMKSSSIKLNKVFSKVSLDSAPIIKKLNERCYGE